MRNAWILALAALACSAHGDGKGWPEASVAQGVECDPALVPGPPAMVEECPACFHVDADGRGECRLDIARAEVAEVMPVLRWASSARDRCRAWDDTVTLPLAKMVVAKGKDPGFRSVTGPIRSLKSAIAAPGFVRRPELEGLELQLFSGENADGVVWGGLTRYVYADPPADLEVSSCCTRPECTGTVYRCAPRFIGDLPVLCEKL